MRQLDHSIRPLYGIDDLEYLLYFIGIAIVVNVPEVRLLTTAAHAKSQKDARC